MAYESLGIGRNSIVMALNAKMEQQLFWGGGYYFLGYLLWPDKISGYPD